MVQGLARKALLWSSMILFVLGGFFFIETILYYFIPPLWAQFAPDYRRDPNNEIWMGHPRYYFRSDPLLSFDINPLAKANHVTLDGWEYPIFANDLGCFDRNRRKDFADSTHEYAYFAGDSFTSGFADYDDKFATVWEKATGILAAKCGVSHTGTIHQFEKFKRVIETIGRKPKVVFVGLFPNDLINDSAFPHSTVIEGFLVETVLTNEPGQLTRLDPEKMVTGVSRQIEAFKTIDIKRSLADNRYGEQRRL